jgi:hypothetical protein
MLEFTNIYIGDRDKCLPAIFIVSMDIFGGTGRATLTSSENSCWRCRQGEAHTK